MLEFVAPNPAWTVVLVLNILDREATNVLAANQDIKDPNVNLTGLYIQLKEYQIDPYLLQFDYLFFVGLWIFL